MDQEGFTTDVAGPVTDVAGSVTDVVGSATDVAGSTTDVIFLQNFPTPMKWLMSLIAKYLLLLSIVLAMFCDRSSLLLFSDVQVYAADSTNLPFQRKTIATLFLGFFFVL